MSHEPEQYLRGHPQQVRQRRGGLPFLINCRSNPGIRPAGRERVGDGLRLLLARRGESEGPGTAVDQHCGVARRLAVPHEVDDDRLPVAATTDRMPPVPTNHRHDR